MEEFLDFEEKDEKKKVGRPKLASKEEKRKSLIIASVSFLVVIILCTIGYGVLFGYRNINLGASATRTSNELIMVDELSAVSYDVTLKVGTVRKIYFMVKPASANNKTLDYKSTDESVAKVDKEGRITALKEGSCKIIATTTDGSGLSAEIKVNVIENASSTCEFRKAEKQSNGISYDIDCNNATIKQIQYKVGNDSYQVLDTKKSTDLIKLSNSQLNKTITVKAVYTANGSTLKKYVTKKVNDVSTTKVASKNGTCDFELSKATANSVRYDINCKNAEITKIAYKIGNSNYIGIDTANVADVITFEPSNVTRVLYFKVDYVSDGDKKVKTVAKSTIIDKVIEDISTLNKE